MSNEQVNKIDRGSHSADFSHNANKLVVRSTGDIENSDNSDSGEGDEENDRRNMVTIYEIDDNLYNKIYLAAFFPSQQGTLLSSVTTTGKPEDDTMMVSVFTEVSESYNQTSKNWREPASEEVTKVVSVAFQETLSEAALKTCKFAQAKLASPAFLLLCILQ